MIETDETLKTELDFFVVAIRHLRKLQKEQGFLAAAKFREEMNDYFRLNTEMRSAFVHDEIVRLADTSAGTLTKRNESYLDLLFDLENGDRFRLDRTLCIFRRHFPTHDNGFFQYEEDEKRGILEQMDYNVAWNLATDGRITFGN